MFGVYHPSSSRKPEVETSGCSMYEVNHSKLFFNDDVDTPGAEGFIAEFHRPGLAECA